MMNNNNNNIDADHTIYSNNSKKSLKRIIMSVPTIAVVCDMYSDSW